MRRFLAAGILIAFSCANQQLQITPPENFHKQKPPVVTARQLTALDRLRKLKPRITALVAQLASPSFKTREKAKEELLEIGLPAVPALEEAAKSTDPEVAHAANILAQSLRPAVKRLVKIKDRSSVPDSALQTRLEQTNFFSIPAKGKLTDYAKFLRSKAKINIFLHPDLAAQDPRVELEKQQYSLPGLLEIIAEKLDATWVARFGVLYLARPGKALELASAEILTAPDEKDKEMFHADALTGITISYEKEIAFKEVLDFFHEVRKLKFILGEGVSPNLTIKPFEVKEIRLRDALSLLLFSLNLKGEFKNMKITITRADYSHFSEKLHKVQTQLQLYRRAWENLEVPGR